MDAQTNVEDLPPCDLILRGGITSGVVYPGTVAGLAAKYRFVCIGGASAGAIAAGVTAAAEYGRQVGGRPDAFEKVAGLAHEIGGGTTNLRKLFRATPKLRILDWLLWRGLSAGPLATLGAVASPSIAIGLGAWLGGAGIAWGLALTFGGLIATVGALVWQVVRGLPAAGYGLCPGIHPGIEQTEDALRHRGALMDWMHATMQRLAGRTVGQVPEGKDAPLALGDSPLTMGDLWGSPDTLAERRLDLVLTTTNLSQQVAHRFPFLEPSGTNLFFQPDELARVLPRDVVRWMVRAAQGEVVADGVRLLRLPAPGDLPVLFGVRLSLSFPGLISAVPLHARDASIPRTSDTTAATRASRRPARFRRAWFSDGGITSNFPVDAFDSVLPRRPTFCINLRELPTDDEEAGPRTEADMVWMPRDNRDALRPPFLASRRRGGGGEWHDDPTLAGFVGAIVNTARNAQENALQLTPGQRDRIVTVLTRDNEGGLNLNMPAETIALLSKRGADAAGRLVDRFHPDGAEAREGALMGWRNHRWIRLRATLSGVERLLAEISAAWRHPDAQAGSYADARAAWSPTHPANATSVPKGKRVTPGYRWASDSAARAAGDGVDEIIRLADTLGARASAKATQTGEPHASLFDSGPSAASASKTAGASSGAAPRPKLGWRLRAVGGDPRANLTYR
ncbi:patatin-like phospholipase family protein [Roseomonas fluvialis]|uniref:Suppressor n=1 Tax=Roseomonas fluvialis TaxID=1750527 RepID=A0ABM7Y788_9PROT|nr:patatin-like phospholipase family protein [Roseomonas fluvialis]BDG73830.1 suppressor [Roseomonas fluvialis]